MGEFSPRVYPYNVSIDSRATRGKRYLPRAHSTAPRMLDRGFRLVGDSFGTAHAVNGESKRKVSMGLGRLGAGGLGRLGAGSLAPWLYRITKPLRRGLVALGERIPHHALDALLVLHRAIMVTAILVLHGNQLAEHDLLHGAGGLQSLLHLPDVGR